jgi:hypothetical protein
MADHECPHPACDASVPSGKLACSRHWYAIPKPLRDAVWKAWNHGTGRGSVAHNAAITAAIQHLRGTA